MELYKIKVNYIGSIHAGWKWKIETWMDKLPYVVLTPDQAECRELFMASIPNYWIIVKPVFVIYHPSPRLNKLLGVIQISIDYQSTFVLLLLLLLLTTKIGIQAHFLLTVIIPPLGLKNCCLTLRILKWITWILASMFMVTIIGISLSHNSSLTHFSGDGPLLSLDGWCHWYPQGASICSWASHLSQETHVPSCLWGHCWQESCFPSLLWQECSSRCHPYAW